MAIPTLEEYVAMERRRLTQQLTQIAQAPLADRRAARKAWAAALLDPELLEHRAQWLMDGNYGWGAGLAAAEIQAQKRGNRTAALAQLLAAVEWQCPPSFAREAFTKLSKAAQRRANAAINLALKCEACVSVD